MNTFTITIPEIPVAKARPRARFVGKGKKGFISFYNTKAVNDAEKAIVDHLTDNGVFLLFAQKVPVHVELYYYVPIPASWSKKDKAKALSGELQAVTKPDLDNYVKLTMDAMNGIVFYDDNQVVVLTSSKQYSDNPRTEIKITQIVYDND